MSDDLDAGTRLVLGRIAEWSADAGDPSPAAARADLERFAAFTPPRLKGIECWDESIPGSGGPLLLRLHRPATADSGGAVLYVHGGGWVTGSVELVEPVCQHLARASRLTVAAVDYRLSPEAPHPAALDDAEAALDWLRARSPQARVAVVGESAGGAIVAGLALRRRDRGERGPDLQALVYPALDPSMATESHRRYGVGYGLDGELMKWYWHQYVGQSSEPSPYAAPARASSLARLPPTIVLTAGLDPLLDEAREFASRLKADGTSVEILHYPQAIHGFIFCGGAIPRGVAALRELGALIAHGLR